MQYAQSQGWKRCYSCHALVEHNQGCIHMTCKCRAQFCYICCAKWRTCSCSDNQLDAVIRAAANARAVIERREREAQARIREAEGAALARAGKIVRERAELNEILREIEEFEAMEALRLAAEEEERRREMQLKREQQEAERIDKISRHFLSLRNELDMLHMFQRIGMTTRHEDATRRSKHAEQECETIEASEVAMIQIAARAKVADSKIRLESEHQQCLEAQQNIEEGYIAQLKIYWYAQQVAHPEGRVAEAMKVYRVQSEMSQRSWDAERKSRHQGVIDAADEEVRTVRLRLEKSQAERIRRVAREQKEGRRRLNADDRWLIEVVQVRREMLDHMEREEFARVVLLESVD
ncbi:MAG: hypothetical protein M1818_002115 [Claussenomyces sp. TS43310]|nr:MAG: hypothetical protein M1818_002115 [Claussenomyces sp. TS43310]